MSHSKCLSARMDLVLVAWCVQEVQGLVLYDEAVV